MSGGPRRRGGRWPVAGDTGNGYVETDPTGRYGRFDELLGKGAMKSVYRGFDEELGVEVAWNQASLSSVLIRSADAVHRMHSEVELLRALRHDAIIGFHASWVDTRRRTFNFITELFSSGTLRSYRLRYPSVRLAAVRSWSRQILAGLAYLHAHDPPVIHRDLKCDNVFVNGHLGQVKIGDLGLAAVLRGAGGAAHSVIGTPEFMAPEMYDEEYDERVDVYAFGMCVLEMVTVEYPYSECSNPAQIYKKVTAGKLPDAFYRVEDEEARRFIGRCLVAADARPSAAELLLDPFLVDDHGHDHHHVVDATSTTPGVVVVPAPSSACFFSSSDDDGQDDVAGADPAPAMERYGGSGSGNGMTITGKLNAEEDTIFLKVQLPADDQSGGHARNIYFPFDMASDTAAEVAGEMVKELDITDRDAAEIAAMIEQEIGRLLPGRAQQQQHEYAYAAYAAAHEDGDGERPPTFYYLSSSSPSSQGSYASAGRGFPGPHVGGWSKDDWYALSDDDDTASSMHSGKYSALHYASGHEEVEEEDEAERPGPSCSSPKARNNNTRFGPGESPRGAAAHHEHGPPARQVQQLQRGVSPSASASASPSPLHAGRPRRREDGRRLTRNRSMVDMRSQLLHRTLVEELNRRLFFNTVGAVESVGFRAPSSPSPAAAARGRRSRDRDGGGGQQRYYML